MANETALSEYLTKHELAVRFGKSTRWVERMVARGLPVICVGHVRLFRLSSLEQWLQDNERSRNASVIGSSTRISGGDA